jgi:formylglycine-generating enzyme
MSRVVRWWHGDSRMVALTAVVTTLLACKSAPLPCPGGMAPLSGGTFTTGEQARTVTIEPFCLDTTEVTADAYAACVRTGKCGTEKLGAFAREPLCNYGVEGRANHPMNCVDWEQAVSFCGAQGERLPTEDEWEWAARGQGRGTIYPWGNDEPTTQLCWKQEGTCRVGSHPEGDAPGGFHDLSGNVWEWTSSVSGAGGRIYRGGSWGSNEPRYLRASSWSRNAPELAYNILGFRCAR